MPRSENFDPGRVQSAAGTVYGIKMELAGQDPFRQLVGGDWSTCRWYATAVERDAALADMRREHEYSRRGDRPTLIYSKVEGSKPVAPVISGVSQP